MYGVAWRFCWMFFVSMISLSYLNMVYGRLVWSPSPWLYLMMKGVLFAAASVISFLESLRKIFLTLCLLPWQSSLPPRCSPWCCWPLRGSPQRPAAPRTMFEEVTSWDTKCAQFGAKKQSWWLTNTCQCPKDLPFPRNCAGRSGRIFDGKKSSEEGSSDCRCEEKDPCEEFGAERHWLKDPWEGPIDIGRPVQRSKQSPQSHQGMRPQLRNRPILRLLGLPFRNVP